MVLPLLDELAGGLSVAAAPTLGRDTGTGLLGLSTLLLSVPMLTGFLEAPILAWTDRKRHARQRLVAAGLAGMAASLILTSFAHGPLALALAAALYGPMNGIALGTGEAMYVDGAGDDTDRRLARWTVFASLGDVLAPAILALTTLAGISWRTCFAMCGVALMLVAAATLRVEMTPIEAHDDDKPEEPVWQSLRHALGHRTLVAWLAGAALCTLLDELLAVLSSVWISERFSPSLAAPTLIAFSVGSTVGSLWLERLLARHSPLRLLAASSVACAASLIAWLWAPTWPFALAGAFAVGLTAGPLHPLAKARAFAAMPTRPGLVNGASQAFIVLDLVAPALLAFTAERWGLRTALGLLALQPVGLAILVFTSRKAP